MGKKLTTEKIDTILKNSKATVEMEGLNPSPEAEEITKACLNGEISNKEAKRRILALHGLEL